MVVWVNWETRRNSFTTRQGALSQGTALKSAKSSMTRECHVLFRSGLLDQPRPPTSSKK